MSGDDKRQDDPAASLIERVAARLATPSPAITPPSPPEPEPPPRLRPAVVAPMRPADERLRPRRSVSLNQAALARHGLITADGPATPTGEEFRLLSHQLRQTLREQACLGKGRAALVMITSARAGEGKTFVACNLALALAGAGDVEVVLVDADLKRPSVARRLGINAERGLGAYLGDPPTDPGDILLGTDQPGLMVVAGGGGGLASPDLGRRLGTLLPALAQGVGERIVVLDTPPVLGSTLPQLLAPLVDHVLIVVAAEETHAAALQETKDSLQASHAKCSFVLNKSGGALHALIGNAASY